MSALGADDHNRYLAECLEILEQKVKADDRAAILIALHQVLLMRAPVPEWLRDAFIAVYQDAIGFNVASWDEVFGNPHREKIRLKTRKQYRDLRYPIAWHVHQRSASGENIDKQMFEDIAKDLKKTGALEEVGLEHISGSTVSRIYYRHGGKEFYELLELFDSNSQLS